MPLKQRLRRGYRHLTTSLMTALIPYGLRIPRLGKWTGDACNIVTSNGRITTIYGGNPAKPLKPRQRFHESDDGAMP